MGIAHRRRNILVARDLLYLRQRPRRVHAHAISMMRNAAVFVLYDLSRGLPSLTGKWERPQAPQNSYEFPEMISSDDPDA